MAIDSSAAPPLPPVAPGADQPSRPVTRRELLIGAAAGGAALLATNAANTAVTHGISTRVAERRARQELEATRAELQAEISRLQRQLALYHDLERVGLDQLIHGILEVYDRLWPTIRAGVATLRKGLQAVDEGLLHFEASLPILRGAAETLRGLLAGVEAQVQGVRDIVNEVLKRTAPIGEAVSGFLTWLMNRMPFGIGARVQEASDRLSALVGTVPSIIDDTRLRLLKPLDEEWLAAADGQGLLGRLFTPLRQGLLTPLAVHLQEVDSALSGWDEKVAKPLRTALDEREKIRKQIAALDRPQPVAQTEDRARPA